MAIVSTQNMENVTKTRFIVRRAIGARKRNTVDGIATHCGFIDPAPAGRYGELAIQRACDRFFAIRGMVWMPQSGDYLPMKS